MTCFRQRVNSAIWPNLIRVFGQVSLGHLGKSYSPRWTIFRLLIWRIGAYQLP